MNDEHDLTTELAAAVVERVSPDELPIFDDVAEEYFRDPARALADNRRDEPLGFGLDLALVGPYALAIAVPVVQLLGSIAQDLIKDLAKDAAEPHLRDLVRRMLTRRTGRRASGALPVTLTPAQVLKVQNTSFRTATSLGLPDEQARLLSDAIVGSLHRDVG